MFVLPATVSSNYDGGIGDGTNNYTDSLLREPELTTNVARGKLASQSTTSNSKYGASNALDGILSSNMKDHSCTATHRERNAWWLVDLKDVYEIWAVVITSPNSGEWKHEAAIN